MTEQSKSGLIFLNGGAIYLTEKSDCTCKVVSGNVLVYILPLYQDGRMGRRYLLYEAEENEHLPSFAIPDGEKTWLFGLVALEQAELEEIPDSMSAAVGEEFVRKAQLANFGEENYQEQILEEYNRNLVKEENYIYATEQEREETKRRILRQIYKLFDRDALKQKTPESGQRLYDAAAYVCDRANIAISPYDKVVASGGRRFRLEDIARVSHFIIREVLLERDWFRHDSGPLIGFLEDGNRPVALMPHGSHGYTVYLPDTRERCRVNQKFAERLKPQAYQCYRSFPNEKMTVRNLFLFGLQETDGRDWMYFILLTVLGTLIGILLPFLNEQIYDKYIPLGFTAGIVQLCAVLLACNLGGLSFSIVKNLASFRGIAKMEHAVLAACCERLFHLPESFFRNYESADLSERVLKMEELFQLISRVAVKTVIGALFALMYLLQMKHYSSDLTGKGILMVLIILAVIIILAVRQMKYEEELMETGAQSNSKMYQFLVGIPKIRMAGVEDRALYEYLKPYIRSKEISMRKERLTNAAGVLAASSAGIFTVVMYHQTVVRQMAMTVGQFSAFMAAFGAFTAAMMSVGMALPKLSCIIPLLKRIRPVLQSLPEYSDDSELPGELTGKIELSNVSFAYDKEAEPVLKNISLQIKAGEYIGIVGASGCGKSTLLKLLLGFEKPDAGKIYYDEKDIDKMDKRELRKKLGVVLQEGSLISGSIFENITISAPKADLQDAEQVAKQVGLWEDIEKMPMGMHTVLSGTGGTVSGGQRQRILIARAIAGKPKILFLDEATSALDNVTQAHVCRSLARLRTTRLVIAHRLSTIQDCDRIIVLDEGQIAEAGSYEQLMAQKGLFYDLASRQLAGNEI